MTKKRTVNNPKMADGQLSPKVTWPALALLAIGIVLVVLHFILKDDGTLLNIGLTAIGASGLVGGIGYQAKLGQVQMPLATGGTVQHSAVTGPGPVAPGAEFPTMTKKDRS
jgi:hypothetical protein